MDTKSIRQFISQILDAGKRSISALGARFTSDEPEFKPTGSKSGIAPPKGKGRYYIAGTCVVVSNEFWDTEEEAEQAMYEHDFSVWTIPTPQDDLEVIRSEPS